MLLPGDHIIGNPVFLIGTGGMFLCMVVLWRLKPSAKWLVGLAGLSILVRVGFIISFPAGDDINRYIWEGHIQNHGHNPFATSPDAAQLLDLRNDIWEGVNHKSIPTIYWPAAQLTFRALAALSLDDHLFKAAFVAFDIAIAWLLFAFLKRNGGALYHLLLYLLNPLVIVFVAGEGHLESAYVFLVLLTLYLRFRGRPVAMYLTIGLATMVKANALMFLPLLITKRNIRALPLIVVPFLTAIPFLLGGNSLLEVPFLFATEFKHNGLFYSLASNVFEGPVALGCCIICAALLSIGIFFLTPDRTRASFYLAAVFLLFSPTVHPWYFLIITPFVVLYQSLPWLIIHLTALPLTFYWYEPATGPLWDNLSALMAYEYVPMLFAAFWIFAKGMQHSPKGYSTVESIAVVIPTLNEEKRIQACLDSLKNQGQTPQIIVVDGGSLDSTVSIAQGNANTTVLTSAPGRGIQATTGVDHTTADTIMILHADSRLVPGTLVRVLDNLNRHRDAVGGALGAYYDNDQVQFKLTQALNTIRAKVFGISFGDQAQFFRRAAFKDAMPRLRLMEDVEISFRMLERGAVLFLPGGVAASSRMWKKVGYGKNFFKVIYLTSRYIVRRAFGLLKGDCSDFYRMYYGK